MASWQEPPQGVSILQNLVGRNKHFEEKINVEIAETLKTSIESVNVLIHHHHGTLIARYSSLRRPPQIHRNNELVDRVSGDQGIVISVKSVRHVFVGYPIMIGF